MEKKFQQFNDSELLDNDNSLIEKTHESLAKSLALTEEILNHFQKYSHHDENWLIAQSFIESSIKQIYEYDQKVLKNFKLIFESKKITPNAKIVAFINFENNLFDRLEKMNMIKDMDSFVKFKDSIPGFHFIKIEELVKMFLKDLKNKKDSLGLPIVIYEKNIDDKLKNLIESTNNQNLILENTNLGIKERLKQFKDINQEINSIDKDVHNGTIEGIKLKFYDDKTFEDINKFFIKMSKHFQERITMIEKMITFVNNSGNFGNEDRAEIQGLLSDKNRKLKSRRNNLENLINNIKNKIADDKREERERKEKEEREKEEEEKRKEKEEKERKEKEERERKEKEELEKSKIIVKTVENAFITVQKFRPNKKIVKEDGTKWEVGMSISKQELEIKEPNIEEINFVKINYTIVGITDTIDKSVIIVGATISCNNFKDIIKIEMSGFYSDLKMDKEIVDNYLSKLKSKYTTWSFMDYTFHFAIGEKYTIEELEIDLIKPDFYAEFECVINYVDHEMGQVSVDVKITRNYYQNFKTIFIDGFKKAFNDEIDNFLKSYNYDHPFDLKYEINLWNSYRDIISKINERMIEIGIGQAFVNTLDWKTDNIDEKIIVDNPSGEFSKKIFVYFNGNKIGDYDIAFKNVALINFDEPITINFENDNSFDLILSQADYGEVSKSFVLIEDFLKKYHSWDFFVNHYKKIVLKDIEYTSKNVKINKELKKDVELLNNNEILLKDSFINAQYQMYKETYKAEHEIFKQQSRIWCELSINEKDQLTITFVLSGINIVMEYRFPFYLWLRVNQITIENDPNIEEKEYLV